MLKIIEWLEMLPQPIRDQAINNLIPKNKNRKSDDINDAIVGAFIWRNSPEGSEYWSGIASTYRGNTSGILEGEKLPLGSLMEIADNLKEDHEYPHIVEIGEYDGEHRYRCAVAPGVWGNQNFKRIVYRND
jgi:hypothetical protein